MSHGATRRPRTRLPGWAMLASALLTALVVNAAVTANLPGTVTPSAKAAPLPVTLTAVGGTSSVSAGTVASTTGLVPVLVAATTISIARDGAQDWDVQLAVTAVSGITGGETLVLVLVDGLSTQTISLNSGSAVPQVTSVLTLDGGGLLVTAATLSLVSGCHSCSVTAELRITPSGATLPSFVYPYTILTAA